MTPCLPYNKDMKNTHLEHLEDSLFNEGYAGAQNAINFLKSLRDMLTTGHGGGDTKVTVKWDGAPAIICGTDPETQKFFVGTKSVFAKESKVCYTDADVDRFYAGHPIAGYLKSCLQHLPECNIKGVLQGDLLYTQTPPVTMMGGKRCYTFKPNTITYAVEESSSMGAKIASSKLGIVFHTSYEGASIQSLSSSFGVDVSGLQGNDNVAVFSAEFQNINGSANLSSTELARINNTIRIAERNLLVAKRFLNEIQQERGNFSNTALFKIYFNQLIKSGHVPSNSAMLAAGFKRFVDQRYLQEIGKKKTEKTQKLWQERRASASRYLNNNTSVMYATLSGFKSLTLAKEQIINKLKKIEGVGTFLEEENGYRVTSPEGFVAIKDGAALKLVDRLEFSRANFTVAKNWGK